MIGGTLQGRLARAGRRPAPEDGVHIRTRKPDRADPLSFDLLPVLPEINALQSGMRKQVEARTSRKRKNTATAKTSARTSSATSA